MAKKESKNNKENKHFFKDFKSELKKVIWPTPKQLVNNTTVVVALVLITALIVFVLDLCFDSVNKYGITKLQTMLQNTVSVEENSEETQPEENSENNSEEEQENSTEASKESNESVNVSNQETTESNE